MSLVVVFIFIMIAIVLIIILKNRSINNKEIHFNDEINVDSGVKANDVETTSKIMSTIHLEFKRNEGTLQKSDLRLSFEPKKKVSKGALTINE